MPASTYIDRQKYPKCIIESNIKNGPIDNIIDQSYYPEATIGCYMYKSVCGSTPHTFSDHIRGFVEPNAGAHYYVQSANSTNFSGAKLTVNLNNVTVGTKNNRNAYIAISMIASGTRLGNCDIGFCNTGDGWYPMIWAPDQSTTPRSGIDAKEKNGVYIKLSDKKTYLTGTVTIEASVEKKNGRDYVNARFLKNGSVVASATLYDPAGDYFSKNSTKPLLRWVRFVSLVPKDDKTGDWNDKSFLNVDLTNLKLVQASNGADVTWGNSNAHVEYAWSLQGANISSLKISNITPGGTAGKDHVEIIHRYKLH